MVRLRKLLRDTGTSTRRERKLTFTPPPGCSMRAIPLSDAGQATRVIDQIFAGLLVAPVVL